MSLVDRDLVAEERDAARRAAAAPLRAPRRPGMDEGTRWLALVAGGIGTLLVVTVGGWSLLGHHAAGGIPVIEPLPGPVRVKPVDPGGMQVMSTQVAQTNGPAAEALAPGPEAANPQALQAEVNAARHADAPAAPAAAPAVAAPVQALAVQASPVQGTAGLPVTASVPPQVAGPVPATATSDSDAGTDAADAPAADAPSTPKAAAPAASGGHAVQLAALDSEAAARAEWTRLAHRAPVLFAHREPSIVPVSRDGKRFFRLRMAGFNAASDATAFCGRLHGAGIACTLADF